MIVNIYKKKDVINKNESYRYYKVVWDEGVKKCDHDMMLDTIESLHRRGKRYDIFLITRKMGAEVTIKIS